MVKVLPMILFNILSRFRLSETLANNMTVHVPHASAVDFHCSDDRCYCFLSSRSSCSSQPEVTLTVVEIYAVSSPTFHHLITLCEEFPIAVVTVLYLLLANQSALVGCPLGVCCVQTISCCAVLEESM